MYNLSMNIEGGDIPFLNIQPEKERIGKGYESIVFPLNEDWVLKRINRFENDGSPKSPDRIRYFNDLHASPEFQEEQDKLEKIFGKDYFYKTTYIKGNNEKGDLEWFGIQKRVHGETLKTLVSDREKRIYRNQEEMVFKNREDMSEIIWGMKKAFIELGSPIDFHSQNLMRDERTGKVVIIDTGNPSQEARYIFEESFHHGTKGRLEHSLESSYGRLHLLKEYERYLKLSQEEIDNLDKKYGINDELYNSQVRKLDERRDSIGISAQEMQRRVEEGTAEGMMKKMFAGREEISGNDVLKFADERLKGQEVPKETKRLLERIKEMSKTTGDMKFWKGIIFGEEN